ncbi:MAG: cysteine desulfurase [Ruminococcaceae bacterium]|nr:cysteine desulfurase [Oscillospiraceae bacterium]
MIYLDTAATTPVCGPAAAAVQQAMLQQFANPSSRHFAGVEAAGALERHRAVIAAALGCQKEEIFFTSGGTEANHLAVFGAVEAAKKFREKKRIVISAIEHASVFESAKQLEARGYEVVYLQPDRYGNITAAQLAEAIDENTVLVSMMYINNELGTVLPAAAVKGIIRAKHSPALFHCDCVQAFCKKEFRAAALGADLISVSAHKIFGPKGVGALYIKKGTRIVPQVYGGEQEGKMRPGTQATALIAGFAAAVEAYRSAEYSRAVKAVKAYAVQRLEQLPGIVFNSDEAASEYILNFSLPGYRSEVLLNFLSAQGICVAAGSACAKGKPSHVLSAITRDKAVADSAIRLSFSHLNTPAQIDILTEQLQLALTTLAHERNA